MTDTASRMRRADAVDNRARIVTTAREAFAAQGLDVPLREIARRAGFGIATVYRHFPTRDDLVGEVLASEVAACNADLAAALAERDPGRALTLAIETFGRRQAQARGLNEALLGTHPAGSVFAAQRREHAAAYARLVRRAGQAGALRDGVTLEDARAALLALASMRVTPGRANPTLTRVTRLLLRGLLR